MQLNELTRHPGSVKAKKRLGRGDKTAGSGHKGQKSRGKGKVPARFEGGQMPIQMRLPKFGETSFKGLTHQEIRTSELHKVPEEIRKEAVTIETLKSCGLVKKNTKTVKVFLSGTIDFVVNLVGMPVSKGAKELIESQGGSVK